MAHFTNHLNLSLHHTRSQMQDKNTINTVAVILNFRSVNTAKNYTSTSWEIQEEEKNLCSGNSTTKPSQQQTKTAIHTQDGMFCCQPHAAIASNTIFFQKRAGVLRMLCQMSAKSSRVYLSVAIYTLSPNLHLDFQDPQKIIPHLQRFFE